MTTSTLITYRLIPHLLAMLSYSQRYFYLANFSINITNDWRTRDLRTFLTALSSRARTGLDVRFLLASPPGIPRLAARNMSYTHYLAALDIPTRFYSGPSVQHAKFAISDDNSVIIGSHNLTFRSLKSNVEVSILLEDPTLAATLRPVFDHLWDIAKPS